MLDNKLCLANRIYELICLFQDVINNRARVSSNITVSFALLV